jgi:porphobilinogen synthase
VVPELGVMTDVALDPSPATARTACSTTTGYILNDETVAVLVQQALDPGRGRRRHRRAQRHDGRPHRRIRQALEAAG